MKTGAKPNPVMENSKNALVFPFFFFLSSSSFLPRVVKNHSKMDKRIYSQIFTKTDMQHYRAFKNIAHFTDSLHVSDFILGITFLR